MSITTVSELRTALGVGTLYPDATLQSVCDAADNVLLPFLWTNKTPVIGHSNNGTAGILYFEDYVQDVFYVGQQITVAGCGSNFNGSKTVNGVGEKSIEITTTHAANVVKTYHPINPYGSVAATTYTDYSTTPAIQEASLMISISIWGSRQSNSGSAMGPDGTMTSIYAMSNQLLGRVRGLIAPYISPNSMVG
jgi:hypothetical protein